MRANCAGGMGIYACFCALLSIKVHPWEACGAHLSVPSFTGATAVALVVCISWGRVVFVEHGSSTGPHPAKPSPRNQRSQWSDRPGGCWDCYPWAAGWIYFADSWGGTSGFCSPWETYQGHWAATRWGCGLLGRGYWRGKAGVCLMDQGRWCWRRVPDPDLYVKRWWDQHRVFLRLQVCFGNCVLI